MLQILDVTCQNEWNDIVRSFVEYDVYYLNGYVRAFQLHGDGKPQLLYYDEDGLRAVYVYMKRATAIKGLFDSITPYGYGGVLFEGDIVKEKLENYWKAYVERMREENIVDNFVRYHPVLSNAKLMKIVSNVVDLGKTIALDLEAPGVIWSNITSKNRNMIRKAEKNGIEIHHGHNWELFDDFIHIYNGTMEKDNAEKYYFFDQKFYRSIYEDLDGNYEIFYATHEGKIVAISIVLFANKKMHYHLSGSIWEYRNLAPTNLLLYKAALWGCEQGYKIFHLGGGVGAGEDSLYKFKAAFNRNSDYQFSVGKQMFDKEKYATLVEERAKQGNNFNRESSFFPLYRS